MIEFKKRKSLEQDLMSDAIKTLRDRKVSFDIITSDEADKVSKANSKAMVLMYCKKTEDGYYQIQVKDKEFYSYTRKLLKDIFRMRLVGENKKERTFTAECEHKGLLDDYLEILGLKYNLSLVKND